MLTIATLLYRRSPELSFFKVIPNFYRNKKKILKSIYNNKRPKEPKQIWARRAKLEASTTWFHKPKEHSTSTKAFTHTHTYTHLYTMEHNTKTRNKPTHLQSTKLWNRCQEHIMEKGWYKFSVTYCSPWRLHRFTFPPTVHKDSLISTSLLKLVVSIFF